MNTNLEPHTAHDISNFSRVESIPELVHKIVADLINRSELICGCGAKWIVAAEMVGNHCSCWYRRDHWAK